jgi:hypothetical protein
MEAHHKAATAWGGVGVAKCLEVIGVTSWGDAAAMLAALYSAILIGEWFYKKWKARRGL